MKRQYFLTFTLLPLVIILFNSGCKKDETPSQPQNQAPQIQSLTSTPATSWSNKLTAGGIITFLCTATDPEKDPLSYTWECSGGSFIEGQNTNTVKWLSPIDLNDKDYTITVNVSDGALVSKKDIYAYVAKATPGINAIPTILAFSTNIDTIEIKIFNIGTGTLNWQIQNLASWMTANPSSGSIPSSTDTAKSKIIVNRTSLTAGNYNQTINAVNTNNTTNKVAIAVSMVVPSYGNVEGHTYYSHTTIPVSGVSVNIENKYYTTSSDGYYSLNNITPGSKTLKATKDGYDQIVITINVVQGINTQNIDMTSGSYTHLLLGTVKAASTQQPLQNVKVIVLNDDESESQLSTTTDYNGDYSVPTVPQGQRKIKFQKQNYQTITPQIFMSNSNYQYNAQLANKPGFPYNPIPSDNAVNQPFALTLGWDCTDPDGDALKYDVFFGTVNPPTEMISQNQTMDTLSKSGLTANTTYYWKVKAKDNFNNSAEGPVWQFTTKLNYPTLISPVNNSANISLSPSLSWNSVAGATSYTLQVSTNSSFSTFFFNQNVGNFTSKQLTGLVNSTKYYWRVSASNNDGTSDWSSAWQFTTGGPPQPPVLSSPNNGATNVLIPVTLTWNASSGAISYRLQVSTSDQFTATSFDQSNITSTSQSVSGLNGAIRYYWRVNVTTGNGTSDWSSVRNFTTVAQPCPDLPTVPFYGKNYNTVYINGQCWLKENLDVGEMIPGNQNPSDSTSIEKYCYSNNLSNCDTYGGLYQWDEAMQYVTNESAQGICPSGWHIPKISQLQALRDFVGGDVIALLKAGQGNGNNSSGFTALLAGNRGNNGLFGDSGFSASFWSSTKYSSTNAYSMVLYSSAGITLSNDALWTNGYSVRCLKD